MESTAYVLTKEENKRKRRSKDITRASVLVAVYVIAFLYYVSQASLTGIIISTFLLVLAFAMDDLKEKEYKRAEKYKDNYLQLLHEKYEEIKESENND